MSLSIPLEGSMARRWIVAALVVTLVIVLVPASTGAQPASKKQPKNLATVRYILHGLSVQPPHHKTQKGRKNMKLYNKYFLQTKKNQRASIRFRDKTTLQMNQLTDLVLQNPHVTVVKRGE